MAQRSGKIVFYEGKHFTGPKLEVGDCDNFQDRGFMNRVNSIHAESGPWVCFDHPDFRSQQFILEHGDYPDFFCWNGHNDHMGSRRPVGMSRGWPRSCVKAAKVYGMERGCCTRSPTTAAAWSCWSAATWAASPTGRRTAAACSRCAGSSTSSSRRDGDRGNKGGGRRWYGRPALCGAGTADASEPRLWGRPHRQGDPAGQGSDPAGALGRLLS